MEHDAKIIEDNGGGISLYVLAQDETCIYAHSGYECAGRQLLQDLAALIADDSVADWEGNEPDLVAEWPDLDLDTPHHRQIIAEVRDGVLHTYPHLMGGAGKEVFGHTPDAPECIKCGKAMAEMSAEEIFHARRLFVSPQWGKVRAVVCPACQ